MRKTKIVCTLGPSTDNYETLKELAIAGMNVARINFSHGNKEERDIKIQQLNQLKQETNLDVARLLDTKGPEIRTGYVKGYSQDNKKAQITITKDSTITFICDEKETQLDGKLSDKSTIYLSYNKLPQEIEVGQIILIDDGQIETKVTNIEGNKVTAKALNSGEISSRRGINLPGAKISMPVLNEKDKADLMYGIENDFDFVALSFTRKAEDVIACRNFLDENGGKYIKIISKIENQEGIDNLDEILSFSDGIMVARGDMGVEIPFERVPSIQKMMINKALEYEKIVITATQMLESMIQNPRPTRAEVSDVFNAIDDSTTCIMLSGETAYGEYSVEAVKTMVKIAIESETILDHPYRLSERNINTNGHVTSSTCFAAVTMAQKVNAKAILTYTSSGLTAKKISSLRPGIPIIAVTPNEKVHRQNSIHWGVTSIYDSKIRTVIELFRDSEKIALNNRVAEVGDNIVVVLGTPVGIPGSTNTLKVVSIGNPILRGISKGTGTATGKIKICRNIEEAKEKLQDGDLAVFYKLSSEFTEFFPKLKGLLLYGTNYDNATLTKLQSYNVPIIVDVRGVHHRLEDGMTLTINSEKQVVLKEEDTKNLK